MSGSKLLNVIYGTYDKAISCVPLFCEHVNCGAIIAIEVGQNNPGVGNPWVPYGLLPVFINQVLLGHRHTYQLCVVCGHFCTTAAEISSYDQDHVA